MSLKHKKGALSGLWSTAPGQDRAEKRRNYRMLNTKHTEADSIVTYPLIEKTGRNGQKYFQGGRVVFRKMDQEELERRKARKEMYGPSALDRLDSNPPKDD